MARLRWWRRNDRSASQSFASAAVSALVVVMAVTGMAISHSADPFEVLGVALAFLGVVVLSTRGAVAWRQDRRL